MRKIFVLTPVVVPLKMVALVIQVKSSSEQQIGNKVKVQNSHGKQPKNRGVIVK
jgi:hypothetical protein